MSAVFEAFHLDTPGGFRFCVLRQPTAGTPSRGTIVHVHAFAEEMNKSRHMVALAAEAWAQQGWSVLQVDLGGCGDSAGEFSEASWQGWLEDVRLAHGWAQSRSDAPVWLWGLRLGALLAGEAAARFRLDCGLLLWQPVTSGKQHLQQFLRLWQGARIVGKAGAKGEASPQQRLATGETVEIAGYELSPPLAEGMAAAQLDTIHAPHGVHWFQLGAATGSAVSPVIERLKAKWQADGVPVRVHVFSGPAFWQTQEIELAPELLAGSCVVPGKGFRS